jgi:hypothetical protein
MAVKKKAVKKKLAKKTTAKKKVAKKKVSAGKKSKAKKAVMRPEGEQAATEVGSKYECVVCGLVVCVDEICGCVETCDIICCGEHMEPA